MDRKFSKIFATGKIPAFTVFATFAFSVFALSGCMATGNDASMNATNSNVNANTIVQQQANNMSDIPNEKVSSVASATSDTVVDSATGERVFVQLHYDSTCQCFVRSALYTNGNGFSTQSQDTLILDSSGVALSVFNPGDADSIVQIRQVTQVKSDTTEVNILYATTLTEDTSGDTTVYDWSGSITGTFNGVAIGPSTFNLTRTYIAGQFGIPTPNNRRTFGDRRDFRRRYF